MYSLPSVMRTCAAINSIPGPIPPPSPALPPSELSLSTFNEACASTKAAATATAH